jgi:hypothetical protein
MKYLCPAGFDFARALELGRLVNAAYDQLAQGAECVPPAGYTVLARLTANEFWKIPVPATYLLEHLLPPVSFDFVATKGSDVYEPRVPRGRWSAAGPPRKMKKTQEKALPSCPKNTLSTWMLGMTPSAISASDY